MLASSRHSADQEHSRQLDEERVLTTQAQTGADATTCENNARGSARPSANTQRRHRSRTAQRVSPINRLAVPRIGTEAFASVARMG